MSGGTFNYKQWEILSVVEQIEEFLEQDQRDEAWQQLEPDTRLEFMRAIKYLKIAYAYAQRIDWYMAGDEGSDTFHKKLKQELQELGAFDPL